MRAALHVELATDIEDVFFHRVDTEDEVISDLVVGRAIYQPPIGHDPFCESPCWSLNSSDMLLPPFAAQPFL